MTMYKDIYQDLPLRVCEVWQQNKSATGSLGDLSVTAMLMAAAAGFAMPWESLKDIGVGNRDTWNSHPSFAHGDQSHYQDLLKKCDQFLSKKISDNVSLQSAAFHQCENLSDICDVVESGNKGMLLAPNQHTVRCIVRVFRNALAHNNLVAFGANLDKIEKLGFFSENRVGSGCASTLNGYLVATLSVIELGNFLDEWFHILKTEKPI